MKFISWNVNGLRSVICKGFYDFLDKEQPDFLSIQETKMQEEQFSGDYRGYYHYWSSAIKKGYSGTLILCKKAPISVTYGINGEYNDEGRVITLEYDTFYLVNVYSPNSQDELKRLTYRMEYEDKLREYLFSLSNIKHVILCGDLNVAHQEIDLKNPKTNTRNAGFTIEERTKFTALLEAGFIDTFRYLYPDTIKYSWWSYRFKAREKNAGWRIDYFVTSNSLKDKIHDSLIYNDVFGSDHCPVGLILDL